MEVTSRQPKGVKLSISKITNYNSSWIRFVCTLLCIRNKVHDHDAVNHLIIIGYKSRFKVPVNNKCTIFVLLFKFNKWAKLPVVQVRVGGNANFPRISKGYQVPQWWFMKMKHYMTLSRRFFFLEHWPVVFDVFYAS